MIQSPPQTGSRRHSPAQSNCQQFEPAADGRMWLDAEYRGALDSAGLNSLQAIMHTDQGQCLRVLADRENWRIELQRPNRATGVFYLKKHHVRTAESMLRAAVGAPTGETAGRTEARNVDRLVEAGIGVMRLVAFGERLRGDGRLESFVLTEELDGFEPLDDFLRRCFSPTSAGPKGQRERRLEQLLDQVAQVARRFHAAGYNHRDFYCCHFFVREDAAGEFEIRLIDLQRMQHRRRFRRRWLVKDLAQLAYSAPRDRIGCSARLAFVRRYLGVDKLRPQDKRLIRQVVAKQRRMERRRGTSA